MLIDGKAHAQELKDELKQRIQDFGFIKGRDITLVVVRVGNDPASETYVRNKEKACMEVGIKFEELHLCASTSQAKLNHTIQYYSKAKYVTGLILQLPLPKYLDANEALTYLDPDKDVDGLTAANQGKLFCGDITGHIPCTPLGILNLIQYYEIDKEREGCHAVVVGRSALLGKPMAQLLLQSNWTVTTCHSKTPDLPHYTKDADLLICAAGVPKLITERMVKPGVAIIDAGINRSEDGRLCGDVDFEAVAPKCSFITPAPGGVGPMTVAELLWNTYRAAWK